MHAAQYSPTIKLFICSLLVYVFSIRLVAVSVQGVNEWGLIHTLLNVIESNIRLNLTCYSNSFYSIIRDVCKSIVFNILNGKCTADHDRTTITNNVQALWIVFLLHL